MAERSPQNQDKFIVRLPDGMRDQIKAAAAKNGRSMNGEIVAILDEHFSAKLSNDQLLMIAASGYLMIRRLVDAGHMTEAQFQENTEALVWYVETELGEAPGRKVLGSFRMPIPGGDWITVEHVDNLLTDSRKRFEQERLAQRLSGISGSFSHFLSASAGGNSARPDEDPDDDPGD